MMQFVDSRWPVLLVVVILALLVAWWLFTRATRVDRRERRPDVLDEGAAPARRNQALIDAPPASAGITLPPGAEAMGGVAEVIAAAVQEETVAAAEAAPLSSTPSPHGGADDLTRIKGVGPKLAVLLGSLGVTSYAQIAAWSDADMDRIDGQLGTFSGRPRRDRWIEQARFLAAGDTGGYEGTFGKL